jgi:hypothetical protein
LLSGKASKYYRPEKSGNYGVEIIDSAGCTSISPNVYFKYTPKPSISVKEQSIPGLSIYPNPSGGTININGLSVNSEITIYNTLGQAVLRTFHTPGNTIFIDNLNEGIYVLRIIAGNSTHVEKIVLEKP